jgi:hypothetical protein
MGERREREGREKIERRREMGEMGDGVSAHPCSVCCRSGIGGGNIEEEDEEEEEEGERAWNVAPCVCVLTI